MDSKAPFLKRTPTILVWIGVILVGLLVFWPGTPTRFKNGGFGSFNWSSGAGGVAGEGAGGSESPISRLFEIYAQAWIRFQAKMDDIRNLDEENRRLRLQNAQLRGNLASIQYESQSNKTAKLTRDYELRLNKETGAKVGTTLASISYKVPSQLPLSQLFALGIFYFNARENEKAAVIFSTLIGLEDTDTYKTAKNNLIAGVAWYRLENYALADFYFEQVLRKPEVEDSIQAQAQARLWKALVSKRLDKDLKVQYWLNELVDHHPHSAEAKWVNPSP